MYRVALEMPSSHVVYNMYMYVNRSHTPEVEQGSVLPQMLLQVGTGSRQEVLADPSPRRLVTVSVPHGQWVTLAGSKQHEKQEPE